MREESCRMTEGCRTFLLPLIQAGCVIFARSGIVRAVVREAQLSGAVVYLRDVRRDIGRTVRRDAL